MVKKMSTDPYKGTRDFYPEDMAIQRYIFDTWTRVAETFGFTRYSSSIIEPSELYHAKTSGEIVDEQTYTFTDRGGRQVTLRPEMTPTVARMVAGRRRELSFPIRWYSIENLFRYERPQRGRLREHWQLNCDLFGIDDISADIEIVLLAYTLFKTFGAKDSDFEIQVNNRKIYSDILQSIAKQCGSSLSETQTMEIIRLCDKVYKMPSKEFSDTLATIAGNDLGEAIQKFIDGGEKTKIELLSKEPLSKLFEGLHSLGITNVKLNPVLARGFDYYTGTIFEVVDTSPENSRSLLGGGRYDNLTSLFGGDPISGVGFGLGDVRMRDFLLTHKLIPKEIGVTAPTLIIIPTNTEHNFESEKIAQQFRNAEISVSVDLSDKKLGKKIASARDMSIRYILTLGEDELTSKKYTLKELATKKETSGTLSEIIRLIQ